MAQTADAVLRGGEQALELAKTYGATLQPRLSGGFFDLLRTDIATIRANGEVQSVRSTKRSATVSQNDAIRQGAELVSAIRAAVRTGAPANKALWKAFGVGSKVTPTVRSVSGALSAVIAAAAKFPSETAAIGLLAADLQRAQTYAAAIADADSAQEITKLTSKQMTAQYRAALDRLASNLAHLAAVARIALDSDAANAFAAVVPSSTSRKKPAPAPAPAPQ
ncbi:MAG: hypothetical protein MUC96_00925 [Myxococcaceae bacterium]|jgi:hypothetical protein|nr:hypothetical protein [Myxococcaceae bacterium]